MLNEKYYPFERNRYYYGKLLTAKDFQNEQEYMNDKRRLMNKVVQGVGVISGLNTYTADDLSLIVETGVAIDYLGREIVVDKPMIKKLNTIEGFEENQGDELYLGISYQEEEAELVYSPMSENSNETCQQYNKVKETYKIFFASKEELKVPTSLLDELVQSTLIYEDEELVVRQYTPKFVNPTSPVKIKVELEKNQGIETDYELSYSLDLQGFVTKNGEDTLFVKIEADQLNKGETLQKEYVLQPKKEIAERIDLIARKISLGRKEQTVPLRRDGDKKISIKVREDQVWNWVQEEYYKRSLDQLNSDFAGEVIWLAKVNLIRTPNHCMIDTIVPMPFKQYATNVTQLIIGEKLKAYYPLEANKSGEPLVISKPNPKPVEGGKKEDLSKYLSTGIVEIPIGLNGNIKEAIFSDEIMHGLGKGTVYIDVGVEYLGEEREAQLASNEIILGASELFEEVRWQPIKMKYGVKVYKDKGTFVIAFRLEEAIRVTSLRLRWFAFKLPESQLQIKEELQGEITLSPDTVVLSPQETMIFKPLFSQMAPQPCSFMVMEQGGGTINNMGVYTAPVKEGVYTIHVQVISNPQLVANAFVVVKQEKE